jgi:hypothetical protein
MLFRLAALLLRRRLTLARLFLRLARGRRSLPVWLLIRSRARRWAGMRRWTSRRNVPATDARGPASLMFAAILCQARNRNQHECEYKSKHSFHFELLNMIITKWTGADNS